MSSVLARALLGIGLLSVRYELLFALEWDGFDFCLAQVSDQSEIWGWGWGWFWGCGSGWVGSG